MTEWLEYTHDWGYWINPDTFRTPRIKKSVRVGAVVFLKDRETLDDGRQIIVTAFGVAGKSGIKEMGKKDASIIIASQMLDFMKARKMYPPNTKIKKTYSNGNVDLDYSPTEYDSFTIHLTPKIVDGIVEDILDDLSPFKDEEPEPEESWKVEPAKSSRATCKSCSRPIQQGAIRLGEPTFYEGHINYRWHHLKCAARMIKGLKFETLLGYQELTEEQKKELDRI